MALTDDDKSWMSQTFATKPDLKVIKADLERSATKTDLDVIKADVNGIQAELKRFATKVDLEAMETRLLTAFHQWASPMEARARSHAAASRALHLEQEAISERLAKLEGT